MSEENKELPDGIEEITEGEAVMEIQRSILQKLDFMKALQTDSRELSIAKTKLNEAYMWLSEHYRENLCEKPSGCTNKTCATDGSCPQDNK